MSDSNHIHDRDSHAEEAAAWVVRVQSDAATEADWLALETWLSASVARREAFEEAERLWWEFGDRAGNLRALTGTATEPAVVDLNAHRARRRPARQWAPSAAVAASAALTLLIVWRTQPFGPPQQTYVTRIGERHQIALADGSVVELNSGSRLTTRVDRTHRRVTLDRGEAIFDVAKDHDHPFVVAVGDQDVTVVGTEFDVLRDDGLISVTVDRGLVRVQSAREDRTPAVGLGPGEQLRHIEGEPISTLVHVPADDVLAWRSGYVVYNDRTLADITRDLNRYFHVPIRARGSTAQLRFSGTLKIDNEDSTVRTLQGFLPVSAVRTANEIVLRPR